MPNLPSDLSCLTSGAPAVKTAVFAIHSGGASILMICGLPQVFGPDFIIAVTAFLRMLMLAPKNLTRIFSVLI